MFFNRFFGCIYGQPLTTRSAGYASLSQKTFGSSVCNIRYFKKGDAKIPPTVKTVGFLFA